MSKPTFEPDIDKANARVHELERQLGIAVTADSEYLDTQNERIAELEKQVAERPAAASPAASPTTASPAPTQAEAPSAPKLQSPTELKGLARAIAGNQRKSTSPQPFKGSSGLSRAIAANQRLQNK